MVDDFLDVFNLCVMIEVFGVFWIGFDYDVCFERGIEIFFCLLGFCIFVVEMMFVMIFFVGCGLVVEYEVFCCGVECWLDDCEGIDFLMYG